MKRLSGLEWVLISKAHCNLGIFENAFKTPKPLNFVVKHTVHQRLSVVSPSEFLTYLQALSSYFCILLHLYIIA